MVLISTIDVDVAVGVATISIGMSTRAMKENMFWGISLLLGPSLLVDPSFCTKTRSSSRLLVMSSLKIKN
jgi:hypothetical protein